MTGNKKRLIIPKSGPNWHYSVCLKKGILDDLSIALKPRSTRGSSKKISAQYVEKWLRNGWVKSLCGGVVGFRCIAWWQLATVRLWQFNLGCDLYVICNMSFPPLINVKIQFTIRHSQMNLQKNLQKKRCQQRWGSNWPSIS